MGITTACSQKFPEALTFKSPIATDTIVYYNNFPSKFVDGRNMEIWLPRGYPASGVSYKVLYMHDGQNVLNASSATYGTAWEIDEKLDSLYTAGKIKPTIVVTTASHPKKRFNEYMPQQPASASQSEMVKGLLKTNFGYPDLYSDDYLKFVTQEVLPFVRENYAVSSSPEDTVVMGSSMGGLISLYAMIKYPHLFGKAGCVSSHWPVPYLGDLFINSLKETLPPAQTHAIYFDHGTLTLDHNYEPYQLKVNQIFRDAGYTDDNLLYKKFEGHKHNYVDWQRRVAIPLQFLLQ